MFWFVGVFVKLSRLVESQLPEMQMRLDNLERSSGHLQFEVNSLRRTNDVIKEIKVVEVIFDPSKAGKGVEEINRYLELKFEIYKQFQTESGLVIELARWGIKDE